MNPFEKKEALTGSLEGVIAANIVEDELPLEAEQDEFTAPLQPQELAEQLERFAEKTTSIQGRSRALLVSASLNAKQTNQLAAEEAARAAWNAAPRSTLAAVFHRRILRQASPEHATDALIENLSSVAQVAQSSQAKIHASLLLAELLSQRGEGEQGMLLLDNLARSGVKDLRVDVERIVERLATNTTIAGLTSNETLKTSATLAHELYSAQASSFVSPLISWLRCTRALAQGRVFEAGGYLVELAKVEQAPSMSQGMVELAAQLLSARPQGRPHALALLKQYHKQLGLKNAQLSRPLLRLLARIGLEQNDLQALNVALAAADPAGGTFKEAERILLLRSAHSLPALGAEAQEALASDNPYLFWLSPLSQIAAAPGTANEQNLDERTLASLATQVLTNPSTFGDFIRSESVSHAAYEPLFNGIGASAEANAEAKALRLAGLLSLRLTTLESLEQNTEAHPSEQKESLRLYAVIMAEIAELIESSSLSLLAHSCLFKLDGSEEKKESETKLRQILDEQEQPLRIAAYRALDGETSKASFGNAIDELSDNDFRKALSVEIAASLELEEQVERLEKTGQLVASASLASSSDSPVSPVFTQLMQQDELDPKLQEIVELRRFIELRLENKADGLSQLLQHLSHNNHSSAESTWLAAIWASQDQDAGALLSLSTQLPNDVELQYFVAAHLIVQGHLEKACQLLLESTEHQQLPLLNELAQSLGHYDRVFQVWSERAKRAEDEGKGELRLYCFERLAEIDKERGELASAHLWRRSIAEVYPKHLPSLFEWEEQVFSEKQIEQWPPLGERLAKASLKEEAECYEGLSLLLLLGSGQERRALKRLMARDLSLEAFSELELQILLQSTRKQADLQASRQVLGQLYSRANYAANLHYYALKAGETSSQLNEPSEAMIWFRKALEASPESVVAQLALSREIFKKAAASSDDEKTAALLDLAALLKEPSLKLALMLKGAELQQQAGSLQKAEQQYRAILLLEPPNDAAFFSLEKLIASDRRKELLDLRQERLQWVEHTDERFQLLLSISNDLHCLGQQGEAKEVIEQALIIKPTSKQALELHSELSLTSLDYEGALTSLKKLKLCVEDAAECLGYQRQVADIYLNHQCNFEQAMDAYEEILNSKPDDIEAIAAQVGIFEQLGLSERATRLQTRRLQILTLDSERITAVIHLAHLYETLANESQKAGATLEKARKAWPRSPEILEALCQFMVRHGDEQAKRMLVDRNFKEAVRHLENSPLDPTHFSLLAKLATLSGQDEMAHCIEHARSTLIGDSVDLKGIGLKALSHDLDISLSNSALSPALLLLFKKVGPALEHAFPLDPTSLKPEKIDSGPIFDRIQEAAKACLGSGVELFLATNLKDSMQPLTSSPPRLLVSSTVEQLSSRAFDYALVRSLKTIRLGTAALARVSTEDAWTMLAALLVLFSPNYEPEVEPRKLSSMQALIEKGLAQTGYDADVPIIALEVLGSLPQNPHQVLAPAAQSIANRSALVAVGRLAAAFEVISMSAPKPLPVSGPERLRWLEQQQISKDLILFSCSRNYADLRLGPAAKQKAQERLPLPAPSILPPANEKTPVTKRRAPPGRLPPRSKLPTKPKP